MKRKYTWRPDLPDHRDYLFPQITVDLDLPPVIDLRARCPAVVDQGQLGSCTANALAGAMGFIHGDAAFSRLFIYYNERALEGTVAQDSGAQIRDGIKTLAANGVCLESVWPYVINKFKRKPPVSAYKAAKADVIRSYMRLMTLGDMLHCLADGSPFVFGFTVYESFESQQVAATGVLNMPERGEQVLGGHAVMAVGYDLSAKRLLVRNSWGAEWGQVGYFTMPFDYVTHRGLSDDFWTIRK